MEISSEDFDLLTEKLVNESFVAKVENGLIAPCITSNELSLYDLFDKVAGESFDIPPAADKEGFVLKIAGNLKEVNNFSKQSLSKLKFSELLV